MTDDTQRYNIAAIRDLIRDAFTVDDLHRFCQDRTAFRFIRSHFGPKFSLEDMIDVVIEQCEKNMLFDELLAAVEEVNPRQYERYRDRLYESVDLAVAMESLRARRDETDRQRREMRERQRVVNLRPLDMTHTFKDRIREVQALREHLTDSRVRLVSVVGRSGMGKTALASRVLANLERGRLLVPGEERELTIDGILYLGAQSTGLGLERIYADVGRMLGEPAASRLAARWTAPDTNLSAKVEYLLKTMQDGLYLILLDNLEKHLTRDGDIADEGLRLFVECCLTQPSGAQLIITTREQVKIASAALSSARTLALRKGLPTDEAIALLRELDPQGDLGLRDAPEDMLRCAADLTQGIPRALELVAGILHEDPMVRLSQLLEDEQRVGQEVVEHLVAEGYRSLGDHERRVMEALALFDRPVEEIAVTFLLHPWFADLNVHVALRRLVNRYFVNVNRVTSECSLHPLDREHAYRQLPEGDEPNAYTQRNLELRAAEFFASLRKPESEWESIDDLTPQLAEFEHRVRAGDFDDACRILNLIGPSHLLPWGHYALLVESRKKLVGRLVDPVLQMANLQHLGFAYYSLGQRERAIELYKRSLTIALEIDDRAAEGQIRGRLGRVFYSLSKFELAAESYEEALTIAHEIGDRQTEGVYLGHLSRIHYTLGEIEQAIEVGERALALTREAGDQREESFHFLRMGDVYRVRGKIDRAATLYREILDLAQKSNYRRMERASIAGLGDVHLANGQFEQAINLYREALTIAEETGYLWGKGVTLVRLGKAHYVQRQVQRAIECLEESLTILRELNSRNAEGFCLMMLGKALLANKQFADAKQRCLESRDLEMPQNSYLAALILGIILLNEHLPAAEQFADAVARCEALLAKTADLYEARYTLAAALVGQAVCEPRWVEENKRVELLAPALAQYQQALKNCSAPGIVQDALGDLELIQATGVEGLEPVFELLEYA